MNISVGLDIGWKDIKAIELSDGFKVTRISKIKIPRPINGDETEIYSTKISELLKTHKLSRDNVIINLRGSPILSRTYAPPSKNHDDFEQWFVDNIESLIPGTPISDVVYDYDFLDSGRVLISFARLSTVENKLKVLKACNIIPKAIDASCLALYHAFDKHRWVREKKTFAILDIGAYSSDLLVVKNGEPYISTEISFGGKDLKKGKDRHNIFIQELAIRLERNLQYYHTKENLTIERLIAVGDYSRIPGLKKQVGTILSVKTEIGNPFRSQKIILPSDFSHKNAGQYAQALGLALKGMNSKIGINLMPAEVKEQHRQWHFEKRAKQFFKKSVVAAGIGFVIMVFLLVVLARANNKITREVENLSAQRNELSSVDSRETELNSKIQKLMSLNNAPYFWSQMLYNLGKTVPEGMYLKTIATETRLVSSGSKPEKQTSIVIEGDARDNETVLMYLKNLERYFNNIAVDKMKKEVRCEFKLSLKL
jgi:type IV pilus assembly protein PilM